MEFIKDSFISSDGKTEIACYFYAPEEPKAIIQLSHGMCEYVERYAPHAEYFTSCGFVFCGHDHLGHGNTAATKDDLGYTVSADFLIDDLYKMTKKAKEKYPSLPVFMFGHSMGSFIARCYLSKYGNELAGAVISGTAGSDNPTSLGKLLCKTISLFKNDRHRSSLVKSISTGNYYKKFGKDAPKSAWVSSDPEVLKKYDADPFCNYTFTLNGYYNMFDLLGRVSAKSWADTVSKATPILLIGGSVDPVGGAKGITEVANRLKAADVPDVTVKLWENGRHELLNEVATIRNEVYKTVTDWINSRI